MLKMEMRNFPENQPGKFPTVKPPKNQFKKMEPVLMKNEIPFSFSSQRLRKNWHSIYFYKPYVNHVWKITCV